MFDISKFKFKTRKIVVEDSGNGDLIKRTTFFSGFVLNVALKF